MECCKQAKQQCDYSLVDDDCSYCRQRNILCGPKDYASGRHASSSPSTVRAQPYHFPSRQREGPLGTAVMGVPNAVNRLSNVASDFEQLHPTEDMLQIYNRLGDYIRQQRNSTANLPLIDPQTTIAQNFTPPTRRPSQSQVNENTQTMEGQFP
jgi:hypothetical protein